MSSGFKHENKSVHLKNGTAIWQHAQLFKWGIGLDWDLVTLNPVGKKFLLNHLFLI